MGLQGAQNYRNLMFGKTTWLEKPDKNQRKNSIYMYATAAAATPISPAP
jgi:hypothetical protein